MNRADGSILIETDELVVATSGWAALGHHELRVRVEDEKLLDQAVRFLRSISATAFASKSPIANGDVVQCGFYPVRFEIEGRYLAACEPTLDHTEWRMGANLALQTWRDQAAICEAAGAQFLPPRSKSLAAVSSGFMRRENPVQGLRYRTREDRSGWFFSTPSYEASPADVSAVHIFHVVNERPEISKFLALPPGYWFSTESGKASFDREAAETDGW